MNIPILMYHKVVKKPRKDILVKDIVIEPSTFRMQMKHLKSSNFNTLTPDELRDYIMGRKDSLPPKPIMITFDDAYESVYENAWPVLRLLGLKASIFVPTNLIGKTNEWDVKSGFLPYKIMTAEQIKELSDAGIGFGSHTHNHVNLMHVDNAEKKYELSTSKRILEEITGKEVDSIVYPWGSFDQEVMTAAEEEGYKMGFTIGNQYFSPDKDSRMRIPRVTVTLRDYWPIFYFKIRRQ